MKIKNTTDYVDCSKQKDSWYKLEVINQWDWESTKACFRYVGERLITYKLTLNTPISDTSWKSDTVIEFTEEMKLELTKMGFTPIK